MNFLSGNPGRKCFVPRGKGLGGSSLLTAMLYSRGDKLDYDRWANLLNYSSWNYENVLPYFKKSENFTRTVPSLPIDVDYHGYNGHFRTTQALPAQNLSYSLLDSFKQLGYNVIDHNGKTDFGASFWQYNTKDGKRYGPEDGYISPILNRKNLKVLDNSYVTKILVNVTTKSVTGVTFTRDNKTYIARNRKEVISSAGTYGSAQILMLSGIGPEDHLNSLGIPLIKNLPVGEVLMDQTFTPVIYSTNISNAGQSIKESVRQFLNGQGPLTRGAAYDAAAWVNVTTGPFSNYPDIEFFFNNISGKNLLTRFFGWSNETFNAMDKYVPSPITFFLVPIHPISNGTLKLKSSDPFDYPLIDPRILSADEDIETLYQGVEFTRKMSQTESLRQLNFSLAFDKFPGCEHTESLSKEFWYCYLRSVSAVGSHPIGTCRTGTSPKDGVVDGRLRVFGIQNLRVADASVMPFHTAPHINSVCAMIGEKVSDMIKEEHRQ